jgi:Protein of unknown function (DUF3168)
MIIEQGINEALSGASAVIALAADRIGPLIGTQAATQPRIAYQVTKDQGIGTYTGPSGYSEATVEIDSIGDTYKQCSQLSEAIKAIFDQKALTAGPARISFGKLTDETDVEQGLIEGTEIPVYIRTQTFELLYRAT